MARLIERFYCCKQQKTLHYITQFSVIFLNALPYINLNKLYFYRYNIEEENKGDTTMKKLLIAITAIGLFATFANSSAQAVTSDSTKDKGYISVNTTAEMEIAPDLAEISFAIKTSDTKSMQKATATNKEISDKVYNELKSMINPAVGDYIKTSNFNAAPVYSYSNSKRNLEKYEVSNRVTVHTKSIDNVGKMIDNAINAGATNVDSLSFSVSNYESQCDELISKAAKKAYNRANLLAKAMNSSIAGISNLNTGCNAGGGNQPRLYMAKNMLDAAAGASQESASGMAISNGVIKINANVNATFFAK